VLNVGTNCTGAHETRCDAVELVDGSDIATDDSESAKDTGRTLSIDSAGANEFSWKACFAAFWDSR
jgi:hypothetical protein